MSGTTQRQIDPTTTTNLLTPARPAPADPQVKPKRPYAPRRRFDAAYKQRILLAYDACTNAHERGTLLRREGLYHARIAAWRKDLAKGKINEKKGSAKLRTDH